MFQPSSNGVANRASLASSTPIKWHPRIPLRSTLVTLLTAFALMLFSGWFTLTVAAPTITISIAATTLQRGVPASLQATASGGTAPYQYTVSNGALPSGLTLDANTGAITGTPSSAGVYFFGLTATDSSAFTGVQNFTGGVGQGAPIVNGSNATVAYNSGGSSYTLTASTSGGTPTSLTIASSVSHGSVSVAGATTFTYTPTAGYAGADSFTYTATNAVGSSGTATLSITVSPPTITLSPASGTLSATVGTAFSQNFSGGGGLAPYTYVQSGALPTGVTFNAATGTLSGIPTQNGAFPISVTATDSSTGTNAPFSFQQSFTLAVAQAIPVAVADGAGTNANQAVTIPVAVNDSGAITSIAVAAGPSHGTALVSGLNVLYTPANNYFGSDSFTYTATGPGGTSGAATVTVTVAALAAPSSPPQNASVQAGQSVTLHVAAAATGGPIISVTLTGAPASGSAVVSGTDIVYTAAAGFSGNVQFTYTLSNAFGASLPITATVAVGAVPVAASQSASGAAASTVLVDLMTGATGGPFTAATVGTLTPASAGTATIVNAGTSGSPSFRLRFAAAAAFTGTATVTYTLSNASGPSPSATVTITIAARTNVAADVQVQALVAAQSQTASRFATAQLGNFSRRLESLHGAGWARSSFGLGLTQPATPDKPTLAQWDEDQFDHVVGSPLQAGIRKVGWPMISQAGEATDKKATAANNAILASLPDLPSRPDDVRQALSLWIAGTVDFGRRNASGQQEGFRFTTDGVSMGADYRISDQVTLGVGTGYSRDHSDLGDNGSKSVSQGIVATLYGSVRPTPNIFIDGMLGYGALNFDSTRYVTDDGSLATGQRGGRQVFVSLSSGYEFRGDRWMWSPYGKIDLALTTLAQYTETATGTNALTYYQQQARTSSGTLGVRSEGQYLSRVGMWTPRARVEYRRQFSGADQAGISYADLNAAGPTYVIASNNNFTGSWTAGVGMNLLMSNGLTWILDYSSNLNMGQGRYQSMLFGINMPLR